MLLDENKAIAEAFLSRFNSNDIAGALDCLSDDATWWIAGKPELLPAAGMLDKERIGRLFHRMHHQLIDGLRFTIHGMIAEGDLVAVEAESYGELKNGRVYNQRYHFLMEITDGKIRGVREYLDTQHVFAVWFQE